MIQSHLEALIQTMDYQYCKQFRSVQNVIREGESVDVSVQIFNTQNLNISNRV